MMIIAFGLVILLFMHWIADFVFQDDKTALNKSENNKVLAAHCGIYSIAMACTVFPLFCWFSNAPLTTTFIFFGLMFISHFGIDYITARANKKLWLNNQRHWFFVMVGFDQFLHIATIIWFYFLVISEYNVIVKMLFSQEIK
jgi:hypothetical protein